MVAAVLDALSAPAGAGDLRTRAERCHDALAEAMETLRVQWESAVKSARVREAAAAASCRCSRPPWRRARRAGSGW